jgi:hypothetical protein
VNGREHVRPLGVEALNGADSVSARVGAALAVSDGDFNRLLANEDGRGCSNEAGRREVGRPVDRDRPGGRHGGRLAQRQRAGAGDERALLEPPELLLTGDLGDDPRGVAAARMVHLAEPLTELNPQIFTILESS